MLGPCTVERDDVAIVMGEISRSGVKDAARRPIKGGKATAGFISPPRIGTFKVDERLLRGVDEVCLIK